MLRRSRAIGRWKRLAYIFAGVTCLVIGVIGVYGLFVQKDGFAEVDYDLFDMLAGHAATAVFSSRMYSDSERKLSTIQGFIDLLTK